VAKHLIDTDLYNDLIPSGTTHAFIREIYAKETPGIYFSSIVVQKLLAGARSPAGRKRVEILFRPLRESPNLQPSDSWIDCTDHTLVLDSQWVNQTNEET
jgi:hypothetical protein